MTQTIGAMNRIGELIRQKGIKQVDVAKDRGVGKSTVSMYCSNTMQPSLSRLIKLAKMLNCEIGNLLIIDGKK
ncbi:MAG: helix-turn-helix transcriptional regulator [Candidatus Staskawiczbacteria bacterium]|nr:helix-turn-helix transcriptional regulator [Candidatus Staskawiczbacteria bacterium]